MRDRLGPLHVPGDVTIWRSKARLDQDLAVGVPRGTRSQRWRLLRLRRRPVLGDRGSRREALGSAHSSTRARTAAWQFCDDGEAGGGKQFLRCPFHGMSWHLDGSLREIPCRWDFPHVDEDNFRLQRGAQRASGAASCSSISIRDAEAPGRLSGGSPRALPQPGRCRTATWPCTWKRCCPATGRCAWKASWRPIHVFATHPEGLKTRPAGPSRSTTISAAHVSRFLQNLSSGNPHFEKTFSEAELYQFMGYQDELPDGKTARQAHADKLRDSMGAQLGVDLSGVSNSEMLDSIEYHVFPNACFFPGIVIPLIYRFRPLTVDTCVHDILVLAPAARQRRTTRAGTGRTVGDRRAVRVARFVPGEPPVLRARSGHRQLQAPMGRHQGVAQGHPNARQLPGGAHPPLS